MRYFHRSEGRVPYNSKYAFLITQLYTGRSRIIPVELLLNTDTSSYSLFVNGERLTDKGFNNSGISALTDLRFEVNDADGIFYIDNAKVEKLGWPRFQRSCLPMAGLGLTFATPWRLIKKPRVQPRGFFLWCE